jgi:hypothetical protein
VQIIRETDSIYGNIDIFPRQGSLSYEGSCVSYSKIGGRALWSVAT